MRQERGSYPMFASKSLSPTGVVAIDLTADTDWEEDGKKKHGKSDV